MSFQSLRSTSSNYQRACKLLHNYQSSRVNCRYYISYLCLYSQFITLKTRRVALSHLSLATDALKAPTQDKLSVLTYFPMIRLHEFPRIFLSMMSKFQRQTFAGRSYHPPQWSLWQIRYLNLTHLLSNPTSIFYRRWFALCHALTPSMWCQLQENLFRDLQERYPLHITLKTSPSGVA